MTVVGFISNGNVHLQERLRKGECPFECRKSQLNCDKWIHTKRIEFRPLDTRTLISNANTIFFIIITKVARLRNIDLTDVGSNP